MGLLEFLFCQSVNSLSALYLELKISCSYIKTTFVDDFLFQLYAQLGQSILKSEMSASLALQGSTNQVVHHLTDRLQGVDFDCVDRSVDVVVEPDGLLVVGLPPAGFLLEVDAPVIGRND